jgi:formylglycine-generating enzyme required for sulfatase activity
MFKVFLPTFLLYFFATCTWANNVNITNVVVNGNSISFNISWDNSWRVLAPPANNDAVWVIVKRRDCGSIDYRHQDISSTITDHTFGAPLTGTTVGDKKGIFIHRLDPGVGNIVNVPITLAFDPAPLGDYDFKVIGIEMVLVPSGDFEVGDGSASNGALAASGTSLLQAFHVTSENNLQTTGVIGVTTRLTLHGTTCGTSNLGSFPITYPKGFNAFYAMKYEISLGQYLDFLNSVSGAAGSAALHGYTTPVLGRNPVSGSYPFYTTTTPNRACDSISWAGLLAYLDWTALAPMSEFEFEKLCRGTNLAVTNEFAWASTDYLDIDDLINDGLPNEAGASAGAGLTNVDNDGNALGPYRCGFPATPLTTTRIEVGGSFYGAMELSGNVAERVVAAFNSASCADIHNFTREHGDGEISGAGFADVTSWPSKTIVNAIEPFAGIKGGAWNQVASLAKVSDRSLIYPANRTAANLFGRRAGLGGRGVRRALDPLAASTF